MSVTIASTVLSRLRGLMGCAEHDGVLALVPCNDIHTWGMKKAIDVAFVTEEGEVAASFRDVGPHERLRCRRAVLTLERFADESPWFERGDRVFLANRARASP